MKKNCKLMALFLIGAACVCRADDITREKYPDADSVLVDGLQETVYKADGTYVTTDDQKIKVLTEKGRREESELSLRYNKRYGLAVIESVSIIGPDGVERAVDVSSTTKEATDNSSASANIYDPMDRRIVCTVPGLKIGDTIHYRTRKEAHKARVENQFADITVLEWTCPIVRQVVRVKAPAERPLKNHAVRNPLGNVTFEETKDADGSLVYTWTATESPQAFSEPDAPPLYTLLQNLRVSTAEDWPQLSRWYWNLCVPHLERTNPALTNKVTDLVAGLNTAGLSDEAAQLAKINAIYKWVAQEIRYMGLTMEDTSPGYAPHDVNITFDNRYGVCRDKAALLVAMLRLADLDAFPVLIHAGAKMDVGVPLPYFNHAIVAVRAPGAAAATAEGFILMDPTDESSRDLLPAYLGNRSYLVATPEGEMLHTSPVPSADANCVRVVSEGTLEKDGSVLLSTTADMLGFNDNIYRTTLLRRKPAERRQLFERIVRNVAPGAELLSFDCTPTDLQDTATPIRFKLLTRVPETLLKGETRAEFTPPPLSRGLGAANWLLDGSTSLAKRRFPLDISTTACVDETLTIKLDGNAGPALDFPADETIEGPYEYRRSFAVKDGVFTARRRLAVNAVEVSAAEYEPLRETIKRVEAAERKRPVFAKDDLAGANVRIRQIRRDYDFTSPTAWTVTNTVVKEILTYEGKKKSAELTFDFNPTWKTVELLSAVVSNANGSQVSAVSEKEKNLFDCGWASAAPRYPASKQLVVNLPSVEVGSTITYTTVTTVTNAPTAYYGTFYADVFEPTDELVTRLDGETTILTHPKLLKTEPQQPDGRLWRDCTILSKGSFAELAARLKPATVVKAVDPRTVLGDEKPTVEAIRNWMAKHIRLAGPSLYEVPLAQQLTDPAVVLKERYATRLDYVRTLAALLKGAGYEADIVFAALDADWDAAARQLTFDARRPNEHVFASALCRVTVKDGGFLGFGGTKTVYFVGTENEYQPLGATIFADSRYLDPNDAASAAAGVFDTVTVPSADLLPRTEKVFRIAVRENGMIDVDVEETMYGPGVGGFRKKYAELLPEDRSRHYQELLGGIAQAADATRDLITDTESYPAKRTFSCVVPEFATVSGDAITISLPWLATQLVSLTGSVRETPIALDGGVPTVSRFEVTFPEGYTTIDQMGDSCTLQPGGPDGARIDYTATSARAADGRLTVTLTRATRKSPATHVGPLWLEHLKALNKRATARATRTITVRKVKGNG